MAYRPWNPSWVLTLPNSGILGGPLGENSMRSGLESPTASIAAANRLGRSVMDRPTVMPPALPPIIARREEDVYLRSIRYSAQAIKSRQVFGLVSFMPALCHASPYSPPDRK